MLHPVVGALYKLKLPGNPLCILIKIDWPNKTVTLLVGDRTVTFIGSAFFSILSIIDETQKTDA